MKLLYPLALASSATAATISASCQNFMSGAFSASNNVVPSQPQINSVGDLMANLELQMRGSELNSVAETAPQKNRVIILLDSSGSMSNIRTATVDAFNNLLTQLKTTEAAIGQETQFSLIVFNDEATLTSSDSISAQPQLTVSSSSYNPMGGTALHDAIGCTIEALADEDVNMLYVITDGEENSSSVHETVEEVKTLVDHVVNDKLWEVAYIGSDANAETEANNLGFAHFVDFQATEEGIEEAMEEVGNMISAGLARQARMRY